MSRFLSRAAAVAAAAALAAGALVAVAVPSATAAGEPTLSIAGGPFNNGDIATVTMTGLAPGAAGAISNCKKLVAPAAYSGAASECQPIPSLPMSAIFTADASGRATATIPVIRGVLNDTWTCGPGVGHECNIALTVFGSIETAKAAIVYKASITSVSPAGPYAGGETVTVSFSGAGASQADPAVVALICDADIAYAADGSSCDFATMATPTVGAGGSGAAKIKVVRGKLSTGAICGNGVGQKCSIVVTDVNGRLYASIPVSFKGKQALPAFPTKVAKGKKKILPKRTKQGFALSYRSTTPRICKVVTVKVNGANRRAVKGLRVGVCKLTVTSRGNSGFSPVSTVRKVKVTRR